MTDQVRTGLPTSRSRTIPSPIPPTTDSASPSATGTAVCHSTDQASVARRVPNAIRTDSSRRRSRSCSRVETSMLAAISASVTVEPTSSPVRTLANWLSREKSCKAWTSAIGSRRAAVLRTCSAASGTRGSTRIRARALGSARAAGSRAPGVAKMPKSGRPMGSGRERTSRADSGTVHGRVRPAGSPVAASMWNTTRAPGRAELPASAPTTMPLPSLATKTSPARQGPVCASSRRAAQSPTVTGVVGMWPSSRWDPGP